jgi:hypothetical protein
MYIKIEGDELILPTGGRGKNKVYPRLSKIYKRVSEKKRNK